MAVVSVTIPDAIVTRVTTAICARYNYNAVTDGNQAAFVKAKVIDFLRDNLVAYEASQAAEAARSAAISTAKTDFG